MPLQAPCKRGNALGGSKRLGSFAPMHPTELGGFAHTITACQTRLLIGLAVSPSKQRPDADQVSSLLRLRDGPQAKHVPLGQRGLGRGSIAVWRYVLFSGGALSDAFPIRGSVAGQLTCYSLKDLKGRDGNVGRLLHFSHASLIILLR